MIFEAHKHHGKVIGSLVHMHLRDIPESKLKLGPIEWTLSRGFQSSYDEEPDYVSVTGAIEHAIGVTSITIAVEAGLPAEEIVASIAAELLERAKRSE